MKPGEIIVASSDALPANLDLATTVTRDDAGYFDPLLEIASMRHEFANERLFIS